MTSPHTDDAALFARLRHWKDILPETKNVLPSEHALRWFLRCHEPALVSAGALLKLPRGTYIDPERFKAVALSLMRDPASTRGVA